MAKTPDFGTSEDGIRDLHRTISTADPDAILQWPHNNLVEVGYPPYLVQEHCVRNENWQAVRIAMRGEPTHHKLRMLKDWWDRGIEEAQKAGSAACTVVFTPYEIQVGNYLGALRRGGQLDDQNRIRKYV